MKLDTLLNNQNTHTHIQHPSPNLFTTPHPPTCTCIHHLSLVLCMHFLLANVLQLQKYPTYSMSIHSYNCRIIYHVALNESENELISIK